MIRATIYKKGMASCNFSNVVGGIHVYFSCQVKKIGEKRKQKAENVKENMTQLFGNENEKRPSEMKGRKHFSPRAEQGWRGVRKAASMGHLL